MVYKRGHLLRTLENIIFGTLNTILSQLVEKTYFSKKIFDFFWESASNSASYSKRGSYKNHYSIESSWSLYHIQKLGTERARSLGLD